MKSTNEGDDVSVKQQTKHKLDLRALLGEPKKEEPRTLREIYEEVGVPFTARAVSGVPGERLPCNNVSCGCSYDQYGGLGDEITIVSADVSGRVIPSNDLLHCRKTGRRLTSGFIRSTPRWILLGHK